MTNNGPVAARPAVEPRRGEIMTAAKKVFARNGFDATTIADVAMTTDDGITAAGAADFIVSLVMKGLRPD